MGGHLTRKLTSLQRTEHAAIRAKKAKQVKWPDVEARAKRIFGDRRLPNLVLLEREERAF